MGNKNKNKRLKKGGFTDEQLHRVTEAVKHISSRRGDENFGTSDIWKYFSATQRDEIFGIARTTFGKKFKEHVVNDPNFPVDIRTRNNGTASLEGKRHNFFINHNKPQRSEKEIDRLFGKTKGKPSALEQPKLAQEIPAPDLDFFSSAATWFGHQREALAADDTLTPAAKMIKLGREMQERGKRERRKKVDARAQL